MYLMHLRCPSCGNHRITLETVYNDLLTSGYVEEYRYTCETCGFVFYTKEDK